VPGKLSEYGKYFRAVFLIVPVLLAFLFFGSMLKYRFDRFHGNYSGFIHLREEGIQRNPLLTEDQELSQNLRTFRGGGHDTKFYYTVAFDPFLTRFAKTPEVYSTLVDSPRVRFSRIGYPLLIKLFSGDRAQYFPRTMVWLVLLSNCLAVFALAKIMALHEIHPLWSLTYLLIPGLTVSCVRVLPESISAALLLVGLYAYFRDKLILSAVFLSTAILVRETSAIAVVMIFVWEMFDRRWSRSFILLCSLIPYLGWKLFLTYRLFPVFQWSTLTYSQPVLGFPLNGILAVLQQIQAGQYPPGDRQSAVFYMAMLLLLLIASVYFLFKRRDVVSLTFFVYMFLAISLNYEKVWKGLGNVERTTFEGFLFFIIASLNSTPKSHKHKWRIGFALAVFSSVLLIYDLVFLTADKPFQAGLLLKGFF
jgi:hypothetical protein